MAQARRRSRTPEGRTERQSRREHHPGHRPGKVRADAPRDTRRARYSPIKETIFALPPSGEYGGAGGVEGEPLSPHAPRRAGDPPPRPGSSRRPRMKEKRQSKKVSFSLSLPAPLRAAAAIQGRKRLKKRKTRRSMTSAGLPVSGRVGEGPRVPTWRTCRPRAQPGRKTCPQGPCPLQEQRRAFPQRAQPSARERQTVPRRERRRPAPAG